jgi:methylglutaconyl-CoA hydratase
MPDSLVLIKTDARGVATIILNRPEVNNSYNSEMIQALSEGVSQLASDDRVRLIVLKGNGVHFQAGADLNWINELSSRSNEENITVSKQIASAIQNLDSCLKPTIALIHGGCFGGGTGIVAACDIAIASVDAVFSISEVRWGLHAGPILPQLVTAIGVRNARRFAITGEKFNALDAQKLGLVHEICEEGKLEDTSRPIIDAILKNAPNSILDTKRIIFDIAGLVIDNEKFVDLIRDHAHKRSSEEAAEGLASFREKREASWYPGNI